MTKWNQADGMYKFDRDPEYFQPVLNFLRTGKLTYNRDIPVHAIMEEARFYELQELQRLLVKESMTQKAKKGTRDQIWKCI